MTDAEWRSRVRWVVAHPHRPAVLMVERAGRLALPETGLGDEVWTADATATLPALRELVGVDAVLLRCLREREDPSRRVRQAILVATPRELAPPPPGMRWLGREDLAGAALQDDEQAAAAAGVLDELAAGPGRVPWAVPGWFQDAERWLRDSLDALGRAVTGPVQQLRAWELSCILRAPTAHGDVYLKAVPDSPLFVNEPVVTGALAALFPDHVPAPLAVDAERRWLALADFGAELEWDTPDAVREDVLRIFARLQVEAASQVDRLLAAGCPDRRLPWLAGQAERWLPAIEETGRLPGIDAATWLTNDELAELRAAVPHLTAICAELATYAIPPSLVHGDLHLGNVARGPRGYVFFDWTDASVAHPFLDLLTFFQEDEAEVEGPLRDRLRDAYLSEWTAFEPPERLRRAWRLAEPLGALDQAISYRSIVADLQPVERHTAQSPAYWLRKVLAGLRQVGRVHR
jgi:Phosphotransferase enzyme family